MLPDWGFNQGDMAGSPEAAAVWVATAHQHHNQPEVIT